MNEINLYISIELNHHKNQLNHQFFLPIKHSISHAHNKYKHNFIYFLFSSQLINLTVI